MSNKIVLKLEGDKVISYTVWEQIEKGKNNFNVVKRIDGKTYGMMGTESGEVNFNDIHDEVIKTIQKEYPETRKGIIKFCAIEVAKNV